MQKLKAIAKNPTDLDRHLLTPHSNLSNHELTLNLIKYISSVLEKSTYHRRKSNNKISAHAFKTLTETIGQMNTEPDKAKKFYKFFDYFRAGVDENAGKKGPTLEEHRHKQEHKLHNLNIPDKHTMASEIEEIYNDSPRKPLQVGRNLFQRTIMTASNSGAMDAHGHSLKYVKQILKCNPLAINLLFEIYKKIVTDGIIPDPLKLDIINLLFKNKGAYKDAKNWRPITIAPSLGKMLDKVFSLIINCTDDKNDDNHAYTPNRSCLSAILKVQDFFKGARQTSSDDPTHDYLPVILTEDISAAFESLPEELITSILRRCFECDEIKLDKVVSSYLTRQSYVVDGEDRSKKLKIRKKYANRSSPQGSVLSPKFWRFFDNVFTHHYKKSLNRLVELASNISAVTHCSYADDHLTCLLFKFDKNLDKNLRCRIIHKTALLLRNCLDNSTKIMGCGINPDKSEIICPISFTKNLNNTDLFVEDAKNEYVWLGYSLGITKRYNNFYLDFTRQKIDTKIATCRKMISEIFQYTHNIQIRQKIYQTYISPIIETFIPADIGHRSIHNSDLHKFNHWALCKVLKVPTSASYDEVYTGLGQKSYNHKKEIICNRLFVAFGSELNAHYSVARTLRDGTEIFQFKNKPLDRSDFYDRIFSLNKKYLNRPDIPLPKFDIVTAKKASKDINRRISMRIKKRIQTGS